MTRSRLRGEFGVGGELEGDFGGKGELGGFGGELSSKTKLSIRKMVMAFFLNKNINDIFWHYLKCPCSFPILISLITI